MAVELFGYANINEQMAIQETASAGLKSMEHLIRAVSHQNQQLDCREMTDFTVSKFRKVISMLNRTGHARFRRGPVQSQPPTPAASAPAQNNPRPQDSVSPVYRPQPLNLFSLSSTPAASHTPTAAQPLTIDFTKPSAGFKKEIQLKSKEGFSLSTSGTSSSTFVSSITGEGSVSNGKAGSSSMFLTPSPAINTGRPPLSSKMCREHDHSDNISGKTSGYSRCHCKKRKSKVKQTIRVPAISSKVADIPSDEYSWRKYGQKPIKGSPYPRGYYKCSAVKMCPAKKKVERATDDPKMLIVTYEGDHRHNTQDAMEDIQNAGAGAPTHQLVVLESS